VPGLEVVGGADDVSGRSRTTAVLQCTSLLP
jgi:hypothetical protein